MKISSFVKRTENAGELKVATKCQKDNGILPPTTKDNSKEQNVRISAFCLIIAIILSIVVPVAAGQLQDGSDVSPKENDLEDFQQSKTLAEQGDAQGQYQLGTFYELGIGVPEDCAQAVKWYRMAAQQNHDIAQYNLGSMYEYGCGVPQNTEEAIKWFRRAADQGLNVAQFHLGNIYFHGEGVPIDYTEALKCYRRAAEQEGLMAPIAQMRTGLMYHKGLGVTQNYTEASKWITRAAEQGYDEAPLFLGVMHAAGQVDGKDNISAYMWFDIASSISPPGTDVHNEAVMARDIIAKKLVPSKVSEAQKLSQEWLEKYKKHKK